MLTLSEDVRVEEDREAVQKAIFAPVLQSNSAAPKSQETVTTQGKDGQKQLKD